MVIVRILIVLMLVLTASGNSSVKASEEVGTEASSTLSPISIDFETLANLTPVTTQYQTLGLTFTGATILGQGESLNFLQFPPRSGTKVIYDAPSHSGLIRVDFNPAVTGTVSRVGGFVTGNRNVTLTAYSVGGTVLGSASTGGANYVGVGVPNKLLEVVSSTPIAYARFFNGGERGNTYTVDDFFFERTTTCQISNVPLLKQSNNTWRNDLYGGTTSSTWLYDDDKDGRVDEDPKDGVDNDGDGKIDEDTIETISKWGCALTSAAMIISFHGSQQNGFSTDPRALNNWLRDPANRGYSGGQIDWYAVARYARANGVELYHYEGRERNDGVVNNYLCNGLPIILNTRTGQYSGGHFLVATGQTNDNQWYVNDPGGYNWTNLSTTSYVGFRKFGTTARELNSLTAIVHSPIELLVTDPAGRRTGFDPTTGEYVNEILDSVYGKEVIGAQDGSNASMEVTVFSTGAPLDGGFVIQMIGVDSGRYWIDFIGHDEAGQPSYEWAAGATLPGQIDTLVLEYQQQVGSSIEIPRNLVFLPLLELSTTHRVLNEETLQEPDQFRTPRSPKCTSATPMLDNSCMIEQNP